MKLLAVLLHIYWSNMERIILYFVTFVVLSNVVKYICKKYDIDQPKIEPKDGDILKKPGNKKL